MRSDLSIVHRNVSVTDRHEEAELVGILGWLMIVLAVIPALFIWIGLETHSAFWLWWTVGQALSGVGVLAMSAYMHARAVRLNRRTYISTTGEQAEYAAENYEWRAA